MEERLVNIEMSLANCEKEIEDLNYVVIEQGKIIDALISQFKKLIDTLSQDELKSLSEEVPPPHY